jgi:Tol biopolymer transport system component
VSPLDFPLASYDAFDLSQDGNRALIGVRGVLHWDVWLYDLKELERTRLTRLGGQRPTWSFDETRAFFTSQRDGPLNIYALSFTDLNRVTRLTSGAREQYSSSASPEGLIAITTSPLDGSGAHIEILVPEPGNSTSSIPSDWTETEWHGEFSPNGRMFAYTGQRQEDSRLYVRSYPPSEPPVLVAEDGYEARWSRDGSRLYYRNGQSLYSTTVRLNGDIPVVEESALEFTADNWVDIGGRSFDVDQNGRVLIVVGPAERSTSVIHVVQSILEEHTARFGG